MKIFTAMAATMMLATPALAQQSGHQGMNHGNMAGMNHSMPATAANPYGPAEMQMHQKMMAAQGADASETWTRKMIEHHRGAVEMSQIVMRNGATPAVRREAMKTIASQNREIAALNAMLTRMGKAAQ